MPMPMCVNHPERTASYRTLVDGEWVELCLTCRLEQQGPEDPEEE